MTRKVRASALARYSISGKVAVYRTQVKKNGTICFSLQDTKSTLIIKLNLYEAVLQYTMSHVQSSLMKIPYFTFTAVPNLCESQRTTSPT
jgi:hypothetical protein